MHKRRLIAIAIALMLTLVTTAMWSASTIVREGDQDANFLEDSGSEVGNEEGTEQAPSTEKGKGNKVARIFTAPFRALGKLFGKNNNKLQRMSEKDAEKFESVGVLKVNDERTRAALEGRAETAREHLDAGREYLNKGQLNEAITELSTATSIDPKLGEAHNLLGVAFAQKGLAERAKDSYERAVKAEPQDAQVLNNLGYTLYENGNYRAAVEKLKRAAKLAPGDDRILNNLGLALCRLGKFDDALKSFTRANGELTGHINMARMMERFAREDDAIKYYEGARRIDGRSIFALKRLADLYQRVGKTAESQEARSALAALSAQTNVALSGK